MASMSDDKLEFGFKTMCGWQLCQSKNSSEANYSKQSSHLTDHYVFKSLFPFANYADYQINVQDVTEYRDTDEDENVQEPEVHSETGSSSDQ